MHLFGVTKEKNIYKYEYLILVFSNKKSCVMKTSIQQETKKYAKNEEIISELRTIFHSKMCLQTNRVNSGFQVRIREKCLNWKMIDNIRDGKLLPALNTSYKKNIFSDQYLKKYYI